MLAVQATFATSLTGTLKLPDGTGANGTLTFALAQQGSLSASGGCGGPLIIVPTATVSFKIVSGAVPGGASVYGNDCIAPQGTYYNVQLTDTGGNILFTDRWIVTGSSIDIGNIISVVISGTTQTLGSTGVVLFNPAGSQTINQPAGTAFIVNTQQITGTLTLPNGATCTASGCSGLLSNSVDLTSAQTISGQKTISTSLLFSGANVGSTTAAPNFIYANSNVLTPRLRIYAGTLASPTDFFQFQPNTTHELQLINAVGNTIMQVANFGDVNPLDTSWFFEGTSLFSGGQFWRSITGSDLACSGVADTLTVVRTDVTPPQLQMCLGNVTYKNTFGSDFVTTAGTQTISGSKTFTSDVLFGGSANLGSAAAAPVNGFFSGIAEAPTLRVVNGTLASPTDFFQFVPGALHQVILQNSTGSTVWSYTNNSFSLGGSAMFFAGTVFATDGVYTKAYSGSDLDCAGPVGGNGMLAIRIDTHEFQTCTSGTLRKITIP